MRSLMGQHADFWQVTAEALNYALDSVGIVDRELEFDLMEAYLRLDCYPDVPGTLRQLKKRGLQTAILSNGSPAMLDAAVNNSGLNELIDGIFSVEEVGIFKLTPRVYQLAADRLEIKGLISRHDQRKTEEQWTCILPKRGRGLQQNPPKLPRLCW